MSTVQGCWCGNSTLEPFAPGFLRCPTCETLVAAQMRGTDITRVGNDEQDFYGREYWFSHQEQDLGLPNISVRSRVDLPERCLHWLRTALKYKVPPAKALELGSAHGAFVALLRWAGFDATGLELSPSVVDFARRTFDIPMLVGPIEDQQIEPASLDLIALMDVLEHLPDPTGTMQRCLSLLKPDGVLLIQTPRYREGASYDEMDAQRDPFLTLLREEGHLYLFSQNSVGQLFRRLGAEHLEFELAMFAQYDMFFAASRTPLTMNSAADIEKELSSAPSGRLVQAMLDLDNHLQKLKNRSAQLEADRAARLEVIQEQGRRLGEMEAERNNLRSELADLRQLFEAAEADRAARLDVMQEQGRRLGELEAERNDLRYELADVRQQFETVEADRSKLQAERSRLGAELTELEQRFASLEHQVPIRLLLRLGIIRARS